MERQIVAFVELLRARGLIVSVAETRDALAALTHVPLADPRAFRAALAATLVKDARDRASFDALFDLFFRPLLTRTVAGEGSPGHHHHHHGVAVYEPEIRFAPDLRAASELEQGGHDHAPDTDLRRFFDDAALVQREDPHGGWDSARLRLSLTAAHMLITEEGPLRARLERLAGEIALRRVHGAWSAGELVGLPRRVAERELTLRAVGHLHDRLAEDSVLRAHVARAAEEIAALAPQLVRAYANRELARATARNDRDSDPLPDLPWNALGAADEPALEAAARRLAHAFDGAWGAPAPARRGRLDAARTLRAGRATQGAPFRVAWRGRRRDQPRVVALCDVSLSVRNAARFMLLLSRRLQRGPGAARTFVYAREIAEASHLLAERPFDEACHAIFSGALLDADEASDFGAALAALAGTHENVVTPHTTLLILGDGRNNGAPPRVELFAELATRARRVVWLAPEDRATWGGAGSDLPAYAPFIDLLAPARTPAELERALAQPGAIASTRRRAPMLDAYIVREDDSDRSR